jgi:hypothetical protein
VNEIGAYEYPEPPADARDVPDQVTGHIRHVKRLADLAAFKSKERPTLCLIGLGYRYTFDVLWVMRQVGHADSKMTMDMYAQLQQRPERSHGEAFDAFVRRARERLHGTVEGRSDDRDIRPKFEQRDRVDSGLW